MEVKRCIRCGNYMQDDGIHKLCEKCRLEEEKEFKKVKIFLRENPRSSMQEVQEATGVKRATIIKFIEDDRLIVEGLYKKIGIKEDN